MKYCFAIVAAFSLATSNLAQAASPPSDLPSDIDIVGGMAMLATGAYDCGLRDHAWMNDLLADTKKATENLLHAKYPNGVPSSAAASAATYLMQEESVGIMPDKQGCSAITPNLLNAGDQAVAHARSQ